MVKKFDKKVKLKIVSNIKFYCREYNQTFPISTASWWLIKEREIVFSQKNFLAIFTLIFKNTLL